MKKWKGKKIVFYSLKGGQGKTTLAAALCLENEWPIVTNDIHSPLQKIIKDEFVVKLDLGENIPSEGEEDYENFMNTNWILDFGGYLDPRIVKGLEIADWVVIPVSDFGKFLDTEGFVSTIAEVKQYTKNIIIVLNKMQEKTAKEVKEELKKHNYSFPIFEIKDSTVFENMLTQGITVSEMVKKGGLIGWTYKEVNNQFQKLKNHINGEK